MVVGHTQCCAENLLSNDSINEKQCNIVVLSAEMLTSALRYWIKEIYFCGIKSLSPN